MRTWKLPNPTKVVDKLKSTLLGEMASAEWELLEKQEWDDEAQELAQPPTQTPSQQPLSAPGPEPSGRGSEKDNISRAANGSTDSGEHIDVNEEAMKEHVDSSRQKGSSGWMKLRSR